MKDEEESSNHPPEEESYLTVRQLAQYVHLNEKKIYALIKEGRVPATKVSGKWLFPRRLVDEWLIESAHGKFLHGPMSLGFFTPDRRFHRMAMPSP